MLTTPTPLLGKKRSVRTVMSAEEKKQLAKDKRERLKAAKEVAQLEGWRDINPKLECFEMKDTTNLLKFLTLRSRAAGYTKPIDVFRKFLDDEVLDYLINRFPTNQMIFSVRNRLLKSGERSQSLRTMSISFRDVLQVQAYYIRIIGKSSPERGMSYIHYADMRESIKQCRVHFQQYCPARNVPINLDKARRILAHMTLDGNEAAQLVSKNFNLWY